MGYTDLFVPRSPRQTGVTWAFLRTDAAAARLGGGVFVDGDRRKMNTKTVFLKPEQVDRTWWVVDAKDRILGRMAAKIARILQGKHRPSFTPNTDTGDFIVVVNAEKVRVTGSKARNKEYDWYTYYASGRKVLRYDEMIKRHPTRPIELAVRRMMPKGRLGRRMFAKLKVYAGPSHPHQAQQPQPLEL